MDILQKIKECISKNLQIPIESIADDAHLKEDLFADSYDILKIRLSIENTFGIEFVETELNCMISVDAILFTVQKKVG